MTLELDRLTAQVQATNGVMASAVVLINGLSAQIALVQDELNQQAVTSQRLNDLKTALDMGDDALSALLVANAPAPTPTPTAAPPAPTEPPTPAPTEPPAPAPVDQP